MDATFTTKGRAASRGRYVISESRQATIQAGEVVGAGVIPGKENSDALVHQFGATQTAVPMYAVATALASGKVIPPDALVSAFVELGKLDKLAQAVARAEAKAK